MVILTTGGGGLARVDVADNDDVNVGLLLTGYELVKILMAVKAHLVNR